MKQLNICILGGTGFVGTHLVSRLVQEGHHVRVLTRHRERHRRLLVLPTVEIVQCNIHDGYYLSKYFAQQDVIINLIGILNESGRKGKGFQLAHVQLAQKIVQACENNHIRRLLHMSALNADANTQVSHYLHSKGQAEDLLHVVKHLDVTSFRPSVIFGPGDSFFNRFHKLLQLSPFVLPLACPEARFAPVFVDDVVEAIVHCLHDSRTIDQRYDLCGPHEYTLKQLVEYAAKFIDYKRRILPLNPALSRLQANIMEYMPGKPFSRDNFRSLQVDSVCTGPFPPIFNIKPHRVEEIVPLYLGKHAYRDRYAQYRASALQYLRQRQ